MSPSTFRKLKKGDVFYCLDLIDNNSIETYTILHKFSRPIWFNCRIQSTKRDYKFDNIFLETETIRRASKSLKKIQKLLALNNIIK